MATTTATQIQQLYVGLLGRAADQGGLNWWADQVTTGGKTLEDVRASFVTSTEYTTTYGAATTRADLVTSIYQNLFERTPSADEVKYWAETDTRPADQLVAAFIEFAGAADQAVINNKTFVAQTYTDTVGTSFNAQAAASVIANVDGTTASVNTALNAIAGGTLPGQVPALGLIEAVATAKAAQATYETTNKAALDALVTKLAANPANSATDTVGPAFQARIDAVVTDANNFRAAIGNGDSTAVLGTKASEAATAVSTAYAALTAADKTLATAYTNAIAAEATAKTTVATGTEKGSAIGGLSGDASATTALAGYTGGANGVYTAYVNGNADARAAIDTAFVNSTYYATFKAVAAKDAAYADAIKATAVAKDALDLTPTDTSALQLAYNNAVSAQSAAQADLTSSSVKTTAQNQLAVDADAAAAFTAHGSAAGTPDQQAAALYNEYVAALQANDTGVVAQIQADFGAVAAFTQFQATVQTDVQTQQVYSQSQTNTIAAKANLDAAVAGSDQTGSAAGTTYVEAVDAKALADKAVADATVADSNKAAATALKDAYDAVKLGSSNAQAALDKFTADGVKLAVLTGTDVSATANVKDVFYFADKLTATSATPDFKIGSFGAGDSLVIGSGATYNSGALSTGDNNKVEFFLVKSDAGVQIVLEGANYGSSEVTANTTTGALTSTNADHAQVITLTGVTLDHVSVANGVVSYV